MPWHAIVNKGMSSLSLPTCPSTPADAPAVEIQIADPFSDGLRWTDAELLTLKTGMNY